MVTRTIQRHRLLTPILSFLARYVGFAVVFLGESLPQRTAIPPSVVVPPTHASWRDIIAIISKTRNNEPSTKKRNLSCHVFAGEIFRLS